jgi:hypothetical protein
MAGNEGFTAKISREMSGLPNARAAALLVASACTAVMAGMAAPAYAEPTDPGVAPANSRDATLIQDLNQIGIPYPSEFEAVNNARGACALIAQGHSIQEAVDSVREVNPELSVLQGAHFVWIARKDYCPGHRSPL